MMSLSLRSVDWRRILAAIGLAVGLAGLSGCVVAAAGAGAGAVAYARGDLEATLDSTHPKVLEAARVALGEVSFGGITESEEADKTLLTSRTRADKKVEITIPHSPNKLIHMRIRVGVFGDEQVSRSILEGIKARL